MSLYYLHVLRCKKNRCCRALAMAAVPFRGGLWDSRMSLLCCCNLDGDKKPSLQYMASGSSRFVRGSGHMAVDISFSISPDGLGELFDVMVKAIPQQPFGDFSATWSKVQHCLDSAAEWACAHGRADQCRVLKRLSALLKYGEWGATPLDVPPHPKIAGACLIPVSYEEDRDAWSEHLPWNRRFLVHDLLRASKWLTILAWHFSLRRNRRREFHWCRSCAALLREARRSLRAAPLQGF